MGKVKQPSDADFSAVNGTLHVRLKWSPNYANKWDAVLLAAQKAVDREVLRYMAPYTPRRTGILVDSANLGTVIGSGKIRYNHPGARYLYYGEVYGPNIPIVVGGVLDGFRSPPKKYPTGRPLHYATTVNPLAGSHWFERMKTDKGHLILAAAQAAAEREKKK